MLLHKSKPSTPESNNEVKSSLNEATNIVRTSNTRQQSTASNADSSSLSLNHCTIKGPSQVLLSTVTLFIHDSYRTPHECRALLDSGSQSNFITRQLSNKLKLRHKAINKTVMGISDTPINSIQEAVATIQSRTSAYQAKLPFLIIDKITERLPTFKIKII